jgi:hypothetical protein
MTPGVSSRPSLLSSRFQRRHFASDGNNDDPEVVVDGAPREDGKTLVSMSGHVPAYTNVVALPVHTRPVFPQVPRP